jgi:hypothetical protein
MRNALARTSEATATARLYSSRHFAHKMIFIGQIGDACNHHDAMKPYDRSIGYESICRLFPKMSFILERS